MRLATWALWLLWTAALGWLYTALPPSPDQSLFDYIGWRLLAGAQPYVDVVELNWPGPMLLHAAAVALGGTTLWAWRLFDFLWLTLALGILRARLGRDLHPAAGWAVVVLYQVLYVTGGVWFAGQREATAAPLVLFAALAWGGKRPFRAGLGAGALAGAAALIKPFLGLILLLLGALAGADVALGRARVGAAVRRVGGAALGAALPLGAVALWAARAGWLPAWWEMSVLFNATTYGQDVRPWSEVIRRLAAFAVPSWYWVSALAVLGYLRLRVCAPLLARAALLLAATAVLNALLQRKGFGYHLGPLPLALALASAGLWDWAGQRLRCRTLPGAAAALFLLAAAASATGAKLVRQLGPALSFRLGRIEEATWLQGFTAGDPTVSMADVLQAARFVAARTTPGEPVLTWGRAVAVNVLARRPSPTRFCHPYMLYAAPAHHPRARAWTVEFGAALAASPPRFVLLTRLPEGGYLWLDRPQGPPAVLRRRLAAYRPVARYGGLEIWGEKVATPVSSAAAPGESGSAFLEAGPR